jgi:hypothetical protein
LADGIHSRILGAVASYNDLHDVLRARAEELALSREMIDERAGVQSGYSAKILAPRPIRRLGAFVIELICPALVVKLIAVEDTDALARLKGKAERRHLTGAASLHNGAVEFKFSRRYFQKIGKQGGANSRKGMSRARARARALARRANAIRWDKTRVTESAPTVR